MVPSLPDDPPRQARVCRDDADDICLVQVNGAWEWRHTYRGSLVQP